MILICMTGNQIVGSLGVLQFLDDIKGMTCNSLPTLRPVSPPEASKAATATRLQVLGDSPPATTATPCNSLHRGFRGVLIIKHSVVEHKQLGYLTVNMTTVLQISK